MDIGSRLAFFRELAGISKYKLSQLAGVDPSLITRIEKNDARPSLDSLIRMCEALNITLADFFADDSIVPPELINLMNEARELTPDQVNKLTDFIKSMRDK